jgi:hypothetical protein
MASDREFSPFRFAHSSMRSRRSGDRRTVITGSRPVAGRPLVFGVTAIDFTIFWCYQKTEPKARLAPRFRP